MLTNNTAPPTLWRLPRHTLDLGRGGLVMGILNVTPDSFSDAGRFIDPGAATDHALQMLEEGAGLIDVGGESTRPGAHSVRLEEELSRVIPVITAIAKEAPGALISVDTSKSDVARAALDAGASIVNDVTGLRGDPEIVTVASQYRAGVIIMHMQGTPRDMQQQPRYDDVVSEVRDFFSTQMELAARNGIEEDAVVFDPGIGFGKTLEHNLTLLRRLDELTTRDRPLAVGVSRKSFLGKILDSPRIEDRYWPTVALTSYTRERGALVHRVHDVAPNLQALRMTEAILAA